ncbi:MAG: metallophosphatase domain-containing protein [Bacteroidia bacterium]|nr:metallophosphatase domain-containing protein [Bacteroidia bacterium]
MATVVCISDTHGRHHSVEVPPGDILIHAGDMSARGGYAEIADFMTWFAAQPHAYKICIAGNHDFLAEQSPDLMRSLVPPDCLYLENTTATVLGLRIWGSPVTPWFHDWAFNRHRGDDIRHYWDMIPPDTDILITHGPPFGIRDLTVSGELVGCRDLNHRVWEVNPRLHVFGHIHEAYGVTEVAGTRFVNASMLDIGYRPVHLPVVLEV